MIVGCLIRWADSRVKSCLSINAVFASTTSNNNDEERKEEPGLPERPTWLEKCLQFWDCFKGTFSIRRSLRDL